MKVLIVGNRGMLGKELMAVFSPIHDTVGYDLPELDIAQLESCLSRTEAFHPDVVINAAAYTRVDDCETHEQEAFKANGYGPGNLAKAVDKVGALLVHYSTDYIFDGRKKDPYVEEDAPNPQSVYGKSKLLGENLIRESCSNHLILRTAWLFGPHGANFIRTIVGIAKNGKPLRVVNDQKGSPTYAKDLAEHTRILIDAGCRSTYHLTNSGSCTWYDLTVNALQWAGLVSVPVEPVSTSEFPRPAPRPANSVLANGRLERDGLSLMRSWQIAAREYVERYLKPTL
jgi:dTDP-4-dehydrorhamnose reductase